MANTIIIMADEHNPFVSSLYDHPLVKTPNLERLAKRGTVYKNAYCPSPLCLPSRSAFMAGKRVHTLQTYNNCKVNLNPNYLSYGKDLADKGVYTAYIGKTDVYQVGDELGFSEVINTKDRQEPGDINFCRNPLTIRQEGSERGNGYGVKADANEADIKNVNFAIDWLKNDAQSLTQPWSLTLNLSKPHFPHYSTQELWDFYEDGDNLPDYGKEYESAKHPYAEDLRTHFQVDQFTDKQIRGLRRGYLACVTFVDQQIGRVLDTLEELGQLENTNVIYTSDHGEMFGKFGLWWKCSLYEDSVRVPCIAAGPSFAQGQVVETPVDLLDVRAALYKSVGVKYPEECVGRPLQDIAPNDCQRVVFSEYHGHGMRSGAYMVRKGDWKLIYYMDGPHQLFNLADDPNELNNLYEACFEKSRELEEELRKICSPEKENERAHQFEKNQLAILKNRGA